MKDKQTFDEILTEFAKRDTAGYVVWGQKLDAAHKRELDAAHKQEIAELRTLLASTVGYTCTLCGMKSSKMCGACAVFKAQEILEGGNDEQH